FERPISGIRNEDLIAKFSFALAARIRAQVKADRFPLVMGGDCSVLLGCLLGIDHLAAPGLVFVDGHSDLLNAETSQTGGAAGMDLALAMGIGSGQLSRMRGDRPLVDVRNVLLIGRRDSI